MTELEALLLTKELWMWLSRHPEADKRDWERYKEIESFPGKCPLCQYAWEVAHFGEPYCQDAWEVGPFGRPYCSYCPLKDLWPLNPYGERRCDRGGLWKRWEGGNRDTRIRAAKKIAALCSKRMKQLENEGEKDGN